MVRRLMRGGHECVAYGIHYVDAGTSGGVWGLERGFCQMIGGEKDTAQHLDPPFATLAPAADSAPHAPGRNPKSGGPRNTAICIAGRPAPVTS